MERRKDKYLSDSDIVRIVETYSDMLLRIALNRVRSIPAAEDIVQTVFERLMRRRPIFESREHEKAWLIRTAVNLCLSDLRAESRHGELPLDENIAAAYGEDSFEVVDAVQTLPVQDRYAVYLYYYEGYGVKEIGHLLKEPEGTISSRLSRARKKLKTILEGGNHGRQIQQRL
ncbi:MAG: RNA polymerase sigma factor [Clostridia bacterium]|nr:RNA polymerase sigma factor [Clostridia bacterium]MBQ3650913.1 RNA polymerase sigma factor [Clostridia bacterium]MBQ6866365.1 RNA polymerase sigma factor [Clostridia bacterium]MBR0421156.1 RNA polymerase sigma factor [Clostridia bacterium]